MDNLILSDIWVSYHWPKCSLTLGVKATLSLFYFCCCRIFGISLIFVDMSLIITDLLVTESSMYIPLEYRSISLAIALFFFVDVLLRVYVEG